MHVPMILGWFWISPVGRNPPEISDVVVSKNRGFCTHPNHPFLIGFSISPSILRGFSPYFWKPCYPESSLFRHGHVRREGTHFPPKKPECWRMGNRITVAYCCDILGFHASKNCGALPIGGKRCCWNMIDRSWNDYNNNIQHIWNPHWK